MIMDNMEEQCKLWTIRKPNPMGKASKLDQPWYTRECEKAKGKLREWAKLHKDSNLKNDPTYYGLKTNYKQILQRAENKYGQEIMRKMNEKRVKDPRQWWILLRKLNSEPENRSLPSDISIKTRARHFERLLNKGKRNLDDNGGLKKIAEPAPLLSDRKLREIKNLYWEHSRAISREEVDRAVGRLKKHKATYLDSIPNEAISIIHKAQPQSLETLFNKILTSGFFPSEWSKAYLKPLFKRGDRMEPANYRGIAISSCLGKRFNSIMNSRMEDIMTDWGIQNDLQIGFEKGQSIADHIFVMTTLIDQPRACKQDIYLAFIDMRQAYDRVNRARLFRKLISYQIPTQITRIIMDQYDKIQYCVLTEEGRSFFITTQGLKQGDPFSPRIFNIYIMDIIRIFSLDSDPIFLQGKAIYILFFADDLLLLSIGPEGLQTSLNKLAEYCDEWGLEVNTQKTKAMHISIPGARKSQLGNYNLLYKGQEIECVSSFSYLGVELTEKGHLQTLMDLMRMKAKRAQFKLTKLVRSLTFDTKIWLHRTMVDPILMHGIEVWIAQNRANLVQQHGVYKTYEDQGKKPIPGEKSKLTFIRIQMGAPRFAPILGIRGDTGEYPLYVEGLARALRFRNILEQEDSSSLLRAGFKTQEELASCGQECWFLTLQTVEDRITTLNGGKKAEDKAEMVEMLRKDYNRNWQTKLRDSNLEGKRNSRTRWYRKFKNHMKREEYLNGPKSEIQVAMARLRLGGHNFPVETGRWAKKEFTERKCERCQLNKVGTILHCFQCSGNASWL